MASDNILVIRHGALGDFVMKTGLMHAIRVRHPDAHMTLLTQGFLVDFARTLGYFDEILVDDRGYRLREWWRVVKRIIADTGFDLIYDLQSSNRTIMRYRPLACFLTRHPLRWGRIAKDRKGFNFYCTPSKPSYVPWFARIRHVDLPPFPVDLSNCGAHEEVVRALPERYALLIPGCSAGNPQKRWPAANYRILSDYLFERHGLRSVLIGTKAEAQEIETICSGNEHAVNLMGRSVIADIPEIARRAEVVIGNDTGPTHISRFTGVRTIMLFTAYDAGRAAAKVPNVVNLAAERVADIEVKAVQSAVEDFLK